VVFSLPGGLVDAEKQVLPGRQAAASPQSMLPLCGQREWPARLSATSRYHPAGNDF